MEYCSDLNPNGIRSGDGVQVPGVSCGITWALINEGVNSLPLLKQLFHAIPRSPTPAAPFLSEGERQPGHSQLAFCGTGNKFIFLRICGSTCLWNNFIQTHGGWKEMIFRVPSSPNHSVICSKRR